MDVSAKTKQTDVEKKFYDLEYYFDYCIAFVDMQTVLPL